MSKSQVTTNTNGYECTNSYVRKIRIRSVDRSLRLGHWTFRAERGFTLIEVVMYAALFTIIMAALAAFILGVLRSVISVRAEQAAVTNAALALQAMALEIRHADNVYTPTSVFDNDAAQLSLRSPRNAPTDHEVAFIDFYLDNGVLYAKRDDSIDPVALTSGDVSITAFRVERYANANAEALRLTVTAQPENVDPELAEPKTLRTFVAVRPFSP